MRRATHHRPMIGTMIRGAAAGGVATWVMDALTTGLMADQSKVEATKEKAAQPHGKSTVDNLIDLVSEQLAWTPDADQRARLQQGIHYGLGVMPGAFYALLRHRVPFLGAGNGLVYGFLLWAINDEYLATRLGIAGPVDAYPTETHLRGLAGHFALGITTDTALDLLRA